MFSCLENMQMALQEAQEAFNKGEVPVGAIVVFKGEIIARAHNLTKSLSDPTAHAEILALRRAGEKLSSDKLVDCDLYVTLEPCPMCAHAISLARVRRLYFGAYDEKSGGVENGAKVYDAQSCHHKVEYYGGIMEEESSSLLKSFFVSKR